MIGIPMPNPRDSIITNLNQQLDQFFGAGKTVQLIASGVSGETSLSGASGHSERLRAERDKLAPMLKALAAKRPVPMSWNHRSLRPTSCR